MLPICIQFEVIGVYLNFSYGGFYLNFSSAITEPPGGGGGSLETT